MSRASPCGTGPAPSGLSRDASQAEPLVPDAWFPEVSPALRVAHAGTLMLKRSEVKHQIHKLEAIIRRNMKLARDDDNDDWYFHEVQKIRLLTDISNAIHDKCAVFENPAAAIEARRAETGTGSVHESAAHDSGAAQTLPPNPENT